MCGIGLWPCRIGEMVNTAGGGPGSLNGSLVRYSSLFQSTQHIIGSWSPQAASASLIGQVQLPTGQVIPGLE